MCLNYITNKHKKDIGFGYKIFYLHSNKKLYSEMVCSQIARPINKWIRAKSMNVRTDWGAIYKAGFHIFKKRADALNWALLSDTVVIRKVAYKKVIVSGTQCGWNVIVVKEIKILPKNRRKL